MKATYMVAVRYDVEATCVTPLRTGGTEGDMEDILRTADGRAFLQGTSLSGALRSWLSKKNEAMTERLFGSQEQPGCLILSDAMFRPEANMEIRPRLRINGKTGSADQGGKFDVAHMQTGSVMDFTLFFLGFSDTGDELSAVELMLSAIHSGDIRFGAQKTNGFGKVRLNVKKSVFHMMNPKERKAWFSDEKNGNSISLVDANSFFGVRMTLTGMVDSILIKGSAPGFENGKTVTKNLTEGGRTILPGSSIKGAVRSRAESIAAFCGVQKEIVDEVFGREAKDGDNGKIGHVWFEDMILSGKKSSISRIHINRFTGGVIRGGLFQEEPLQSPVKLTIDVPDSNPIACGLLVYALRDLGMGLYNLGSGGSIGRGFVKADKLTAKTPDGSHAELEFTANGCRITQGKQILRDWLNAVGGETDGI